MSENTGSERPVITRRVVQVLPFIIFALVALTVGLLATRTIESPYETPFFHLFFSDTKHMKVWLSTAALLLVLSQPLTASRSLSPIIASSCLVSVQKIRAFTFTPSWVHLSMVSFSPRCSLCEPRAFQAGHCLLQGECCS